MDSPCGPGAPCHAKIEAMELAHQRAQQELMEKHKREIRELEEQKDRLMEEIQSSAKGKVLWYQRGSTSLELSCSLSASFCMFIFCMFIFLFCGNCDCHVLKCKQ